MKKDTGLTEAREQYAAAYAVHYASRDLRDALELYQKVMAAHPNTEEASYSRMQIQNIARAVVPEQEFFDAQVGMAMAHFGH